MFGLFGFIKGMSKEVNVFREIRAWINVNKVGVRVMNKVEMSGRHSDQRICG